MSPGVASEKDSILATAISAGASTAEAAEKAGLSQRTAQRRIADPEFQQQVAQLRSKLMARALDKMAENMTRAADAIARLIDADNPAISLRASRSMLTLSLRLHDALDLDQRITALKEELERRTGWQPSIS
jgi:uncharacterized membrane protein YqiK